MTTMINLLPKTRWAPLEGEPYKVPRDMEDGKLPKRIKSELESVFDGAKTRFDIGECETLIYSSLDQLPDGTKSKAWNLPSFYSVMASFPSVACACWFLQNLKSIEVSQSYKTATQGSERELPTPSQHHQSTTFRAINEFKNSRGIFSEGSGVPAEGWGKHVWHDRALLADAHFKYTAVEPPPGQGHDIFPPGDWIIPRRALRFASGGSTEEYVMDMQIKAIVEISGRAYLVGSFWINVNLTKGREGCAFTSFYNEVEGSTRAQVSVPTPLGTGTWYYQKHKLKSKFLHLGREVLMETGAEEATMNFSFE